MALPNGAGGYQVGDGNLSEVQLNTQTAPVALTTAATLTAAQLTNGILSASPASNLSYTLPTVALVEELVSSAKVNSSFDFAVINLSDAYTATLATATGWTLSGNMVVAISSSNTFRARKTGDGTWTLYRIS
ncbi:hypothetical protein UFOVP372_42 [uncultured Caudovirales phage]|uniref:Uncharacterized protein n=1 Tax=uncultured Caudovirales phage TaxID=2100421 RepID=A0A6J7X1G4_9CAUD|nr:hypothetical protein UFOVP372_42 [uncultured Caudovirales phage]